MKRTLIHNAEIINEGTRKQGSLVIEDGRIAEILTDGRPLSAPCDETVDATGCLLLPGVIDDHVHFRDPGLTYKADILSESRAAAAGGVTSIMDMPNTNPPTTTLEALEQKQALLAEKCVVNHSCYFGATNDNYDLFPRLDKTRVCGIKLFMGSSTGNMLVDRMDSLRRIFGGTDMLIAARSTRPSSWKARRYPSTSTPTSAPCRPATPLPRWPCSWPRRRGHACTCCTSPRPRSCPSSATRPWTSTSG